MWVVKTLRRSPFLKNAAVLTGTSLLLRTVGIFFRIYLSDRIGAEGMGLYQLVISVYTFASAFAAAGICTAVTRLVAEALARGDRSTALRALRGAVWVSIAAGLLSAGILALTADPLSRYLLKDGRAAAALRILTVSLPFMGVSSCLKGYFLARRRAAVTARAQLLEQAVRIGVIALLLERVGPSDLSAACGAVMLGDVIAEIASCLRLALGFGRDARSLPPHGGERGERVMTALMGIALPVTATRYLNTGLHTAENLLAPAMIALYTGSRPEALAQFGALKGMAMPLLFFPAAFLAAVGNLLVPEISGAAALGRRERVQEAVGRTLQLTLAASILIGGAFTLYAAPLGQLLYHTDEVGVLLRVLGPLVPAMYLETVADSMLKGLGQQVSTLRYSLIDSGVRLLLVLLLVPRTGMGGFLFMMVVSNGMMALLSLHRLLTVTGMRIRWGRWVATPLGALLVAGFASFYTQKTAPVAALPAWAAVGGGLSVLCLMYGALMIVFGGIRRRSFRS